MTTTWPDHLIDLAEWDAMDETEQRFELVEGVLQRLYTPIVRHQILTSWLTTAITLAMGGPRQVGGGIELLIEGGRTPTVRVPDIVVLHRTATVDLRPRLDPADVLAVVEVQSPGTRRVDRMHKLAEYAEVGITHYLLVDPDTPVTATELHLVDGAYRTIGEHHGQAHLDLGVPGGVAVDLDALDAEDR